MKILIADKFQPAGLNALKQLGCDVTFEPETTAEQMAEAVGQANPHILIVRGTKVNAAAIQASESLQLIIRAGAGYDSIDVAEASRRGVFVANCPGKNAVAVAEIAWGLILGCDRRIPQQTSELRQGQWNKKEYSKGRGLKDRTLGIVGVGQIGLEVARRGQAFDMNVVAWSRSLTPQRAQQLGLGHCNSLEELASQSDVVSVHVAANRETAGLLGAPFFQAMKEGAIFINTSRGSVVDHAALKEAVEQRRLQVGLDVFADEPGEPVSEFRDPLLESPQVIGTHHVGASTDQAQDAIADEAVRIVENLVTFGDVINCVNVARKTPATHLLTIRHLNRPGVLAHVFEVLGESQNNVEEMQNIIYDGGEAAFAKIQLDQSLDDQHLQRIRNHANILGVECTPIDNHA